MKLRAYSDVEVTLVESECRVIARKSLMADIEQTDLTLSSSHGSVYHRSLYVLGMDGCRGIPSDIPEMRSRAENFALRCIIVCRQARKEM